MSESFVHSLEWSPPGLGKHKRSVLAVLTSNHVLSLWECLGRPEIATDWVRACVINHALQAHFADDSVEPEVSDQDRFENFRAKQRIRAFSWSQAPPDLSMTGSAREYPATSPVLAVANDRGEVLIITIRSPYDIMSPQTHKWESSVAVSFKVEVPEAKRSPLADCMPSTFKWRSSFVDQLAWSPWATDSTGSPQAILSFTSQSSLQTKVVQLVDENGGNHMSLGRTTQLLPHDPDTQAAGCMKWAPRLKDDQDAYLIYPTRKSFFCIQAQPGSETKFQTSVHEINTPWDEIAGMFIHSHGLESPSLI